MQSTSSNTGQLALTVPPYSQDIYNQSPSTNTLATEWTTNMAAKLTTTSTTTSTITASHTSATTNRTTSSPSKPVMSVPTDRSEWIKTLLHQQKTGVPPLHHALIDKDFEMAEILLAAGADVAAVIQPPFNESDVYFAAIRTQDPEGESKGTTETKPAFDLVHLTEKKKPKPMRSVDAGSQSAASDANDTTTVKILNFVLYTQMHSPGGNLQFVGANALTLCLLSGAPSDFIEKVCDTVARVRPALLNAPDSSGRTPLCIAAALGHAGAVRILLKKGANIATPDRQGISPLDHALNNRHTEVTALLISAGAGAACVKADDDGNDLSEFSLAGLKARTSSIGIREELDLRIIKMLENRNIGALQAYQAYSDANRVAVFRALISYGKKMVDQGSAAQLAELLDFASPLLKPMRLAKLAVAIARRPGQLKALQMVLQRLGDQAFPKTRLSALRDAAGKSGDPAMLELAIALDSSLSKLITGKARPNTRQQAQLNRTLALAMQVRDDRLISALQKRGARVDLDDPALTGLPMIGILADLGNPEMLRSVLTRGGSQRAGSDTNTRLLDAVSDIHTGEGLTTVRRAFNDLMGRYMLHELLCRAVQLNDELAVDELVKAGAEVDYVGSLSTGVTLISFGDKTPVLNAIDNSNLGMLRKLIALGGEIRPSDVHRAYRKSEEFGIAVESLANASEPNPFH